MNNKSYSEKLKDPRWQRKRLQILERDKWTCQICGQTEKTLHVHHRRYLSGKEPWDIPDELLVTLCVDCHEGEEGLEENLRELSDQVRSKFFSSDLTALAGAFENIKITHLPSVVAEAIEYWFGNEELMREMVRRYFDHFEYNGPPVSEDDITF